MNSPENLYLSKIDQFQQELKMVKKKLFVSSMIRLTIFLLAAFLIYYFFGNTKLVIASIIGAIVLFILLVSRHANLQRQKKKLKALIDLNELEIQVLKRDFHNLPDGIEYRNPLHEFSQDIDLFGPRSFYQYLNRTQLKEGKDRLAMLLTENNIDAINLKQEAIQELAEKVDFRQDFSASASLVDSQHKSSSILRWFSEYKNFVPNYAKWLPTVFSVLSVLVIIGYFSDFITVSQMGIYFGVGLLIAGRTLKKTNQLSTDVDKVQATFQHYHYLLELLENANFSSEIMQQKQALISTDKKKASQILKEFSKAIDALDQRNNMIFGFLGNGFLLWDLRQSLKLEKWINAHADQVKNWFEIIEFTDAYNSLGNFALNHPAYTFPKITDNNTILKTTSGVHPLLDPAEAVRNDYQIEQEQFFIITGANMAGKSTFLRTVSLQIVMSNIGLPICASACEYSPIKLITSMRTVDSLADDASYFFAELSRLKFIVDQIKTDRYFIILDEILKGTNSTDKAIGSRKFIEKLVASKSTGIIATHDLSLCEVAKELPQVKNHYFDAEIISDELHFDYRFKNGICQNMNASFLLKKMQIIDD